VAVYDNQEFPTSSVVVSG